MADTYAYWLNALAGTFAPVHESDPQNGFYRKKNRDGSLSPVAIFDHEGEKVALVNGVATDPASVWTWVCDKPVTEAAYSQAVAGAGWPDDPPTVKLSNVSSDPHEALTQEFQGEIELAREFLAKPITTKEQADQAAIWSKRLATIAKKATDLHKVEKQPSLDEGRRVDDKWRDLKDGAADWSKKLKRHLDDWLREQDRIERERQRLAREEAERVAREAEEARLAAERAAAQVEADGISDDATIQAKEAAEAEAARMAEQAAQAEREAQARNASAGRTGSKVALRTFTTAKITDFDALLLALKDRPEVVELVTTLANRAARSGVTLPGMEIIEERRAA